MSKPKVLFVGCGAVGLSQGYHLSAGADITYLVRPGRKPAFLPPKQLYAYKTDKLHTFSSYRVIESVSEVKGETFAFIFDTLDGHTARSENGVATIRSVGNLINEPQNKECFVVFDAVGLDMDEHYASNLRVPKSRLLMAASMLAHQPTPQISIPATASKDLVAKADMLYAPGMPGVGLMVGNTQPTLVKKVSAIYNVNGALVISTIPAFVMAPFQSIVLLHLVVWDIDGFGPFSHLRSNSELWSLLLRAQTEILRLPRYGWTGWFLSLVMGSWATEKAITLPGQGSKPLAYHEFNAFHHGGKVAKQDLMILEEVLDDGEKSGTKMEALREVVRRNKREIDSADRTLYLNTHIFSKGH
ncbi:hypothetical protein COCMIDRAFT_41487 [Bipolaris oryzae ATCC 44560]|uniref:Ketopantoate reductase N-terminal domain-containing protein n=1 Tax=Bipolaris oryzae ATCC 44560 TaxID=930090 RepID=W6Z8W2_COCMI|nr:uncharacterized protein COCMIDRAFT_41487 [Bipolaris oryzae ATCC 44560]EUC40131.1 hypothetical protein COCMIDRAFT_41487 [Bipolaris oryzae ATCC 44560]